MVFFNLCRSQAAIDVINGSYQTQVTVLSTPQDHIGAHYSSRRLYTGIMGPGWCTDIEYYLNFAPTNKFQKAWLKSGPPLLSVLTQSTELLLIKCDKIVSRFPIVNKSKEWIKKFSQGRETLFSINPEVDAREASQRDLRHQIKIRFKNGSFAISDENGIQTYRFDERGWPLEISDGETKVSFALSLNQQWQVKTRQGHLFVSGSPLRLQFVQYGELSLRTFSYTKSGNLQKIIQGSSTLLWQFDRDDNLIRSWNQRGQSSTISYDRNLDVVTSVARSDGCKIQVQYAAPKDSSAWNRRIEKHCPDEIKKVIEVLVELTTLPNGEIRANQIELNSPSWSSAYTLAIDSGSGRISQLRQNPSILKEGAL